VCAACEIDKGWVCQASSPEIGTSVSLPGSLAQKSPARLQPTSLGALFGKGHETRAHTHTQLLLEPNNCSASNINPVQPHHGSNGTDKTYTQKDGSHTRARRGTRAADEQRDKRDRKRKRLRWGALTYTLSAPGTLASISRDSWINAHTPAA
jgi:hypothetical protein